MQSLRILHLEDDPLDAELMLTTLTDAGIGCEILRVDTESSFCSAITASPKKVCSTSPPSAFPCCCACRGADDRAKRSRTRSVKSISRRHCVG